MHVFVVWIWFYTHHAADIRLRTIKKLVNIRSGGAISEGTGEDEQIWYREVEDGQIGYREGE